ncbi:5-methylthioadenosine/S-adenosylhomocysteine deaminase [Methanohalophilus levihalophilus]|uniref:amidohydrolase family protein n=1 Tax=Methanohalophilus levihalophilus TaxID=1431282 RepID=UPI001AE8B016|nr:amidohydrolase family protein [Methanohalophilus levihalophilus]MBP2030471.1 5-methylthioadenosine/S-adenosylhomocysteine deaminase [Methanohalophilus levihalophilus]
MADILIKNGYVLTMDPSKGDLGNGEVAIDGNKIVYVGDSYEGSAENVIDAKGMVVMPGLVNTHTHAGMALLRGYADDLPLSSWLEDHIWPVEAKLTPEDLYIGTKLACLEMIKSGTTCFADMYIHMDNVAKAVEECGIRAALSYGMIDLGDKEKAEHELKEGKRFVCEFNGAADGRITAMYGPHAPHTCSRDFLIRVREQARKDNVKVHIHVLETEAELNQMKTQFGMCSVNMLDEAGFLDGDVLAAHCIWLSGGDMDILRDRCVNVSHNPVSNMKLASGIAPVPELLDRGVNVSLGTDGCASNNNLDMFEEMKMAALLHKVNSMDPTVVDARTVLEMATVNGAQALGIQAGMLKEGNFADLIIVDMNQPHLTPLYDVASHLVYSARGSDVVTTIVNGQLLMKDGVVLPMDENEVLKNATAISKRLVCENCDN